MSIGIDTINKTGIYMYIFGIVGIFICVNEVLFIIKRLIPWAPSSSNHDWSTNFNIKCLDHIGNLSIICDAIGTRNHIIHEA
jgi:hypothetical protein